MRERSVDEVTEKSTEDNTEGGAGRRIDLSVPQVAGSALAAVVAAKLAASFGVYGTILGAGVVSVVATCGGTVFQHVFRRTGEQLKVRRTAEQPRVTAVSTASGPALPGEFGEGTVYRARVRSWKRPVIAAAVVFGVTMGGITAYELITGHNLSGGSSTTVSDAISGHSSSSSSSSDSDSGDSDDSGGTGDDGSAQSPDPGESTGTGSDDAPAATPSGSAGTGDEGTPSDGGSAPDGGTTSSPAPTPSDGGTAAQDQEQDSGGSATTPAPSASGRSETAGPGQDDPAAQ
ncbi:hypothetical protein AB0G32_16375 [Streptomyces sp. NPDC023723]|uniref:hypothetical protein n=1 Tax=Streptomyces sp. NPDC023723 TaxID=3154323 RepID=UPI0033D66D6E